MNFSDLGLAPDLLRAVDDAGYSAPSPIQQRAIPLILDGRDVLAAAQTGTGKTAAFVLPILQRLAFVGQVRSRQVRALVLAPTRELALQVHESVSDYGRYLSLRSAVVFGGVKPGPQIAALRQGVDLLVATPGRLLDLHQQGVMSFDSLEVLVFDEADRMLDMGFIHDIRRIVSLLPRNRQTLMFSATFSKEIRALVANYLVDPVSVEVAPPNSTAERVDQTVYPVDKARKAALLSRLIRDNGWDQVLVFTRTKHGANRLTRQLEKDGIQAMAIHGNKSQNARQNALAGFRAGKVQALVATDIAARGLDIDQLPQVVNYDLPSVPEDYVHRIGRTGRAGASGGSHSLVSADEAEQLYAIERLIKRQLPQRELEGFEPEHRLPERPKRMPSGSRRRGAGSGAAKTASGGKGRPPQGRGGPGRSGPGRGGSQSPAGGQRPAAPQSTPPSRCRSRPAAAEKLPGRSLSFTLDASVFYSRPIPTGREETPDEDTSCGGAGGGQAAGNHGRGSRGPPGRRGPG
jgi:ATP-dependent RNA helicase RhlE